MNQIQRAQVDNLFENTPEDHLKLAYDQFIKKFGKNICVYTFVDCAGPKNN